MSKICIQKWGLRSISMIILLLIMNIPGAVLAKEKNVQSGSTNDRFKNNKFNFTIQTPQGWTLKEEEDQSTFTIDLNDPHGKGTLVVIAVDLSAELSIKDFIAVMEDELGKELPYCNMKKGKKIRNPFGKIGMGQPSMIYREYPGRYMGTKVKTLVGYALKGRYGYCILGVQAESDNDTKKVIYRSMESFRLN